MEQEQKLSLKLKLGEQLTGLSPTVCRRAIAAIREEDERLGGESREENVPLYCKHLMDMFDSQIGSSTISEFYMAQNRQELLEELRQIELFLDIVEGVESAKAQKPAGDRAAIMEEASGRG